MMNANPAYFTLIACARLSAMVVLLAGLSACGRADDSQPRPTASEDAIAAGALPQSLTTRDDSTSPPTSLAEWPRPHSDERRDERERLVEQSIAGGIEPIRDERTLAAMRAVPRHWFVPPDWQRLAYEDSPLPIGLDQTISQPYVVAFMTAALNIQPGDKVLEVGTGSGYQAAVLSELTPHIFTIEILEPLGRQAESTLRQRGYSTVRVRIGDGYKGWPDHAPFDAIMVTAGADHVPQPLLDQLAPGGRLILPMGEVRGLQELVLIKKDTAGRITRESLLPVRFVPLTGEEMEKRQTR